MLKTSNWEPQKELRQVDQVKLKGFACLAGWPDGFYLILWVSSFENQSERKLLEDNIHILLSFIIPAALCFVWLSHSGKDYQIKEWELILLYGTLENVLDFELSFSLVIH